MKFALVCITLTVLTASAAAQENEADQKSSKSPPTVASDEAAKWTLEKLIVRGADSVASHLLKLRSNRILRFPVGRYWVDNFGQLIDATDREIGIWGIDAPRSMPLQTFPRR